MIQLTKENFEAEVLQSKIPVLVDFGASWCPPCRALLPVLKELDKQSNGAYKVCKVDADDNSDLCGEYNVYALPTTIIFKQGKEVSRNQGIRPLQEFVEDLSNG